jgi:ribosomal protein S18 acetylase RimI-like enzyme
MNRAVSIARLADTEADEAFALVQKVFAEFVAPDYSKEGAETFFKLVTSEYIRTLPSRNGLVLAATIAHCIAGILAFRDRGHITLFFVDNRYQGIGVGRKLFTEALTILMKKYSTMHVIDVHSSPYAVPFYSALGFTARAAEQTKNGIRYIPMEYRFSTLTKKDT